MFQRNSVFCRHHQPRFTFRILLCFQLGSGLSAYAVSYIWCSSPRAGPCRFPSTRNPSVRPRILRFGQLLLTSHAPPPLWFSSETCLFLWVQQIVCSRPARTRDVTPIPTRTQSKLYHDVPACQEVSRGPKKKDGKKKGKNIQHRGFAGRHRPNY